MTTFAHKGPNYYNDRILNAWLEEHPDHTDVIAAARRFPGTENDHSRLCQVIRMLVERKRAA